MKKKDGGRIDCQDWMNIMGEIVQNHKICTPENLYNTFIAQLNLNNCNGTTLNVPDKDTNKRKISYLKNV